MVGILLMMKRLRARKSKSFTAKSDSDRRLIAGMAGQNIASKACVNRALITTTLVAFGALALFNLFGLHSKLMGVVDKDEAMEALMATPRTGEEESSPAAIPPSANSSNDSDGDNKLGKSSSMPTFVFHVGPPKTGTTTLQCGFSVLAKELSKNASTYYLGKNCGHISLPKENNETALAGHYLTFEIAALKTTGYNTAALRSRMEHHHALGNNILFSVESFASIDGSIHEEKKDQAWILFRDLFQNWNINIVIAYRHYFDWLPSMYFQRYIGNQRLDRWPHDKGGGGNGRLFIPFLCNTLNNGK